MITATTVRPNPHYLAPTRKAVAGSATPTSTDSAELSEVTAGPKASQLANQAEKVSILVAGAGNAGLTAAVYAARAGYDTLVLGSPFEAQLAKSSEVANFPAQPTQAGLDIVEAQVAQAQEAGARLDETGAKVTGIDRTQSPFLVSLDDGRKLEAGAVILATGTKSRTLGVPGEEEFFGRGVSTCATCDGPF